MIKKIRDILQGNVCLSDFTDKCKNDGACRKCEDEALEKLIAEHDAKTKADAIDEFARFIDKHSHITKDGCEIALDDDITILAEQLKEQNNGKSNEM